MNIKFRAWDKVVNPPKMKTWEQLLAQYQITQVFAGNEFFELMQGTGVKDNNNIEAYQGDILKAPYFEWDKKPRTESYGIIKREKETCNLYIEWHFKRTYDGETYWDKKDLPLWKVKEHEVVGNIYQNKDLLKGED